MLWIIQIGILIKKEIFIRFPLRGQTGVQTESLNYSFLTSLIILYHKTAFCAIDKHA